MKIVTVLGARPQFIKAATVSRVINKKKEINEVIVHTGQHFDENMSDIFFEEMEIPRPSYILNINNLSHGAMTGRMIENIEKILIDEKPDLVLVYGDTNSTLAGALASSKLHIPIAHVESGLRSFNMQMPEEINRVLTDRVSKFLFCPTKKSIENLRKEGFPHKLYNNEYQEIFYTGDVMYDAAIFYAKKSRSKSNIIEKLGLSEKGFILATIHRAENTNYPYRLNSIIEALNEISYYVKIVIPLHPRTKNIIEKIGIKFSSKIDIIDPVGYFDMLELLKNCFLVMTDSGGLQKEAYFFNKFCITLRDETEWIELVENEYNFLVGSDRNKIISTFFRLKDKTFIKDKNLYGDGNSSNKIVNYILNYFSGKKAYDRNY
ncbi:non-hydrolyzing UDP-N-acetylglucosamine 2-epimerase [Persephonella sp.]